MLLLLWPLLYMEYSHASSLYVQRTLMFVYYYQNRTGQVQLVSIVWGEIFICCKEYGFQTRTVQRIEKEKGLRVLRFD